MLESPSFCRKATGEPNLTVLRLLFEYLNYSDRLVNLTQWNDKVRNRVAAAMELNADGIDGDEEDFELRKRNCRDDMAIAGAHFDIHEQTARRIYTTFCIEISHIFKARQTFPTPQQAAAYTPKRTKQALDLNDGVALFIGDCTERKIESPLCKSNDLYSASFSEYKNCTTIKHNVIACGNSRYYKRLL
ncbi:hypothetical protein SARC_07284 [Sphaeroforma arctica JP610]|uniref:Uncharacterized protein n=1 Tax=Sphaeroforma arctica JP610 TaxID=667725 RepID=A0A0L0FUK7_9EUKA|nr:hypothetical protein SARC_07284 [Sphaeroforma arctica JP610]KNC80349.1 hypothetical protein SARC_07284 [Sphaeroforma arctica JP610]|eukprot:XP_014154251.1 hypothetical protein SARC_07284 [Sphaeroforma arctica JP610]